MPEITFLSAMGNRPIVKEFTDTGVNSYPLVKRFTSYTYPYTDLTDLELLLRSASAAGQCIHKGPLKQPLVDESRQRQSAKDDPTRLLILDIDGLDYPVTGVLDHQWMHRTAIDILTDFPQTFRDASCIIQASSSLGRSPDKVSMHLFYLLAQDTNPKLLKHYLTHLNFAVPALEAQIGLSATGTALTYKLDRSVADNSRLIYIATPIFSGSQVDPVLDRIVRTTASTAELDLTAELTALDIETLNQTIAKRVKQMRKFAGKQSKKEKIQMLVVDDTRVPVVMNPDVCIMKFAHDEGDFVRYNINDGDSNAYWVPKFAPDIVYNFKDEPAFSFEAADPETFAWHLDTFLSGAHAEQMAGYRPLAFQDYTTTSYYYGLYNVKDGEMESLVKCKSREYLNNFGAQYGLAIPENPPVWNYQFRPDDDRIIDFKDRFINRYQVPKVLREIVPIDEAWQGLSLGTAGDVLQLACPTIYKIIESVAGDGKPEIEYFLNWLGFIVQKRRKTMTAWVFHGVPGTGKGLLFHHVLAPLLGRSYTSMKRLQDVEERFNAWMESCLLFVVDEFRIDHANNQTSLINKIKNLITETRGTIRGMHTDQAERPLYANMIFFSNDRDAVKVQEGDRRFNIAPRQMQPILPRYPELFKDGLVNALCAAELPIFASILQCYRVQEDAVMLPLENKAKEAMREASEDSVDEFTRAVREGDLDFFIPILDESMRLVGEDYVTPARQQLKSILRDYGPGKVWHTWISELRPLYNVLCGKSDSDIKFGKMLSHHNLATHMIRKSGYGTRRGIEIRWKLKNHDIAELKKRYLTAQDTAFETPRGYKPVNEVLQ